MSTVRGEKKIEPPNHLDTAQAVDKWTEVDGKYHSIMRLRRKTPTQQSRCQSHLNCHSFFSLRVATLFNVYKFSLVGGAWGWTANDWSWESSNHCCVNSSQSPFTHRTSHITTIHHPPNCQSVEVNEHLRSREMTHSTTSATHTHKSQSVEREK